MNVLADLQSPIESAAGHLNRHRNWKGILNEEKKLEADNLFLTAVRADPVCVPDRSPHSQSGLW